MESVWMVIWVITFIISLGGSMMTVSSQDAFEILSLAFALAITQGIVFRLQQLGQDLKRDKTSAFQSLLFKSSCGLPCPIIPFGLFIY